MATTSGRSEEPSDDERARLERQAPKSAPGPRRLGKAIGWLGLGLGAAYVARRGVAQRRAAASLDRRADEQRKARSVRRAVTIRMAPDDVYRFFRDFKNLPRFMENLESVTVIDETRSRWCVKAPAGMRVEWEAEIVDDDPGESITWRSLEGADVHNAGTVRFREAPGDRGTEVRLDMRYAAPGGRVGALVAMLFGREPGQQAERDLRRLKQVLETGHVVHSDATIERGRHPGRPPDEPPSLEGEEVFRGPPSYKTSSPGAGREELS